MLGSTHIGATGATTGTAQASAAPAAMPVPADLTTALRTLLDALTQIAAIVGADLRATGTTASRGAAQLTYPLPSAGTGARIDSRTLLGPHVIDARVQTEATAQFQRRADGSVSKSLFNRPVPEDRTKAAAIVQRLMQSTARFQDPNAARAAGYDFDKHALESGGLLHVSKSGSGLDLDDPNMLLYRKTGDSYKLIGVVLTASRTAPDLGMGTWHTHFGNTDLMKHIWFTPNDLDRAFQEATPPASVI